MITANICRFLNRVSVAKHLPKHQLLFCVNRGNSEFRRSFLSPTYICQEVWDERLKDPLLTKFDPNKYYYELDRKFNSRKEVTAVDIDIFANNVTNSESLEDLEELIHRFRRTPNTCNTFESTSHAVVRAYLQYGSSENLLRILNDRVNYGVFPDHFCYNLMMDSYLKQENYRDAVKVAIFMMLEEDFQHSLSNSLAMYSCHMYLENPKPEPWDPNAEEEPADDDEEVWVRVRYIPLPYFDDHFDLIEPQKLIGKTMAQLGKLQTDSVARSFEFLGWTMFDQWSKAKSCLERALLKDEPGLFQIYLDKAQECISKIPDDDANTKQKRTEELDQLIAQLKKADKIRTDNPLSLLKEMVKNSVLANEAADVKHITKKYSEWMALRRTEIEKQIAAYLKQERLKAVDEKLAELKKKEELLFFFENIEKHRLNIPPEEEDKMITQDGKLSERSLLEVPPEIEGKVGRYSSGIIEQHEPWWRWKEFKDKTEEKH